MGVLKLKIWAGVALCFWGHTAGACEADSLKGAATLEALQSRAIAVCGSRIPAALKDSFQSGVQNIIDQSQASIADGESDLAQEIQESREDIAFLAAQLKEVNHALQDLSSALAGNTTPASDKAVPVPGPSLRVSGARLLKMADGTPAFRPNDPLANTDALALRNHMAESFERMARIFVAGTEQLNRDFPGTYQGPEIKGIYQGYFPDLTNSVKKIIQGAYSPEWGSCRSGIANPLNSSYRWFKSSSGEYVNENIINGVLHNHSLSCSGQKIHGHPEFPLGRGQVVNLYLMLMKKMASDIRDGRIIAPSAYGGMPDPCIKIQIEIDVYRQKLHKIANDPFTGLSTASQNVAECGDLGSMTAMDKAALAKNNKTLTDQRIRTCVFAAQQLSIESRLVQKYAYCSWRAIGDEMRRRVLNQLLSGRGR